MFLVISEIHIPTHTQNAIFLTVPQHFSPYVTFTDSTQLLNTRSVLHPKPQALSQPRKCCISDGCGTVHRKVSADSPTALELGWLPLVVTSGSPFHLPTARCGRRVLYTILVMVSHGRRCTHPSSPSQCCSHRFLTRGTLLPPWTPFGGQHLTRLLPLGYISQL